MSLKAEGKGLHALQKQEGIEGRDRGSCIAQEDSADVSDKGRGADRIIERDPVIAGVGLGNLGIFAAGQGDDIGYAAVGQVEKARRGMLPVCGFLSPGEKELERRLRQEPFARWIKTVAHGLPPRFDPTVEDSRFLADGRQLILSSFPSDVPVFPVNYDNCHLMNARNEVLCRRATGEEEEKKG